MALVLSGRTSGGRTNLSVLLYSVNSVTKLVSEKIGVCGGLLSCIRWCNRRSYEFGVGMDHPYFLMADSLYGVRRGVLSGDGSCQSLRSVSDARGTGM